MKVPYHVEKEDRKALVRAVSEVTGQEAVYQGAPSFAYVVGGYTIDRYGSIDFGSADQEAAASLMAELSMQHGFHGEREVTEAVPDEADQDEAPTTETDSSSEDGTESGVSENAEPVEAPAADFDSVSGRLSIDMPLHGFVESTIDNLENLIAAKAWIIRKMTGADELTIEKDEDRLYFPWFKPDASAVEVDAYSRLIAGLCEAAKTKKRVMAKERQLEDGDNEKFKARCFLLSLDFIGKEYAQARKTLLLPFSGNGSHKAGNGKKAAPEATTSADSGEETTEGDHAPEDITSTDIANTGVVTPLICGECQYHHQYYREEPTLTNAANDIDIYNQPPEKYAHYCLHPSIMSMRLKHTPDWTGLEVAPKWCPLYAESGRQSKMPATAEFGVENTEAAGISEEAAQ